jgi:GNAT superfamily N-acetyltransferase
MLGRWDDPFGMIVFSLPAAGDDRPVSDTRCEVRPARDGDADAVAELAAGLAWSFEFSPDSFRRNYPALLASGDACLLLATDGPDALGYLLGFTHLTFFANGPVGWVEEIFVRDTERGGGVGRALMDAFESWAAGRDCAMVALATRRAAPFYRALGYEESAVYFRKLRADPVRTRLTSQPVQGDGGGPGLLL